MIHWVEVTHGGVGCRAAVWALKVGAYVWTFHGTTFECLFYPAGNEGKVESVGVFQSGLGSDAKDDMERAVLVHALELSIKLEGDYDGASSLLVRAKSGQVPDQQ